jgi:hypothetical protein
VSRPKHRRSHPAVTASTDAPGRPYGSLTARISSPSVTTTPSKQREPRSSDSAATDREAGSVPVSPGTCRCPGIMVSTPASIAARNGGRSRVTTSDRSPDTTASSRCESSTVDPCPGKCLAQAATPADCRPRTAAAPCRATSAGETPNDRVPITGLDGADSTSRHGARSRLIPSAARCVPIAACTASVSPASSTAPSAALPGYGLPDSYQTRVTSPPSSSMATSRSSAADRRDEVSACTLCSPPAMLDAKNVTPASPFSRADSSQPGAAAPGNGGMRTASASRSRTRSFNISLSPRPRPSRHADGAGRSGKRS